MNPSDDATDSLQAVRIPADISRPDRVFGPFTARQALILASAALVLYGAYWLVRPFIEPLAYVVLVIPVAGAVAALALGRREGIGLDRFVLSALVHARSPKRRVYAPEGVSPLPGVVPGRWAEAAGQPPAAMSMPYEGATADGVLDLGRAGRAALATCSTVNFELRSASEQQWLTAAFARWLNSLTGPTQVLVRCHRVDLSPLAHDLHHGAAALPHPALERAARGHADFLTDLARADSMLGRQIVLVAREETSGHRPRSDAGGGRAIQRVHEAARALAAAEVTVTPLDGEQCADLVTAACNPDTPAPTTGPEGDHA